MEDLPSTCTILNFLYYSKYLKNLYFSYRLPGAPETANREQILSDGGRYGGNSIARPPGGDLEAEVPNVTNPG